MDGQVPGATRRRAHLRVLALVLLTRDGAVVVWAWAEAVAALREEGDAYPVRTRAESAEGRHAAVETFAVPAPRGESVHRCEQ